MNKILLNQKGRNHIKVKLLKDSDLDMPTDGAEQIKFCESIFMHLQNDEATRHYYYRNTKKGYQITVYQIKNMVYLTNCIRDMDKNYISTIYVGKNLNDMLGIAKFLRQNIETLMTDYKNQIEEGKDAFEEFTKKAEEA